ncbi:MAG: DUF5711 family protein [Eubacteriales bacterium]|nr:DUF5711 family protein [Eubacteriales bacterium]
MKIRKKTTLNVVKNTEDSTDAVIDQVLEELRKEDEEESSGSTENHMMESKKKIRKKRIAIGIAAVVVVTAAFLVIQMQTYSTARISTTYACDDSGNNSYLQFSNGVLKYSRDGIAFLDRKGEERWNQPYQIKSPIVATYYDKAIVVADKGGNDMLVLDNEGLKGELHANLPIKKVSVSAQGIVCAVLGDEGSPKIVCYDAAGNILVELTTSLKGTGYPMDASMSEDGKMLLVSYLCIENNKIVTKVVYYDFDGKKNNVQDYEVTSDRYEDVAAAEVFFMNKKESAVICDDKILFYRGEKTPKLTETVLLNKKIKSVFHDQKYVGLILKNEGKAGYELCLFNTSGKKLLSQEFVGDYSNVKIDQGQVMMYDGKKCRVFAKNGLEKFDGEMSEPIYEMFPVVGVNKYVVMSPNGMNVIRFVK